MESYMLLAQAIATAVVSFLLYELWCLRKKVRKLTKSPSLNSKVVVNKNYALSAGAWPIIGHLPLLVSAKRPHRAFAALARSCVTFFGKLMAYDHSVMGFTPFGTYWREIRKIATVELFSARRIGMLKPVRQSEVSLWMKGLHEKWVHNGKSSVSVELKSQLEELTFNLLMQMVAESVTTGAIREMYDALPFMAWLDFKGDAKAMRNTQKDLDYIMQTWLDEHRVKADQMCGDAINNTRDFLDVLVMMEKTGQFSSAINDIDTTIKALAP
ncbi:hypothetical protein Sjap_005411 [Stephania japonica]|uniref:Cytochrome P450 n=1 Tax=Stephania japonica TaxID=461633 RepID=A0AAP0PHW5_9MAGN